MLEVATVSLSVQTALHDMKTGQHDAHVGFFLSLWFVQAGYTMRPLDAKWTQRKLGASASLRPVKWRCVLGGKIPPNIYTR